VSVKAWRPCDGEDARVLPGHPSAYLGHGLTGSLSAALHAFDVRRVLVVRGGASYVRCGGAAAVERLEVSFVLGEISGVSPNPSWESVVQAVAVAHGFNPDAVVGIGGGSVMDTAKVVACLCELADEEIAIRPSRRRPRAARLVLLPTVPGSGAEMTGFATVYSQGRKVSFTAADARADLVLVDPYLALSVPERNLAVCTLDGLCQSVESWWATAGSRASRELSRIGLRYLLKGIDIGGEVGPERSASLYRLALGSSITGSAINYAQTTAAHALSYWLTGFKGFPHGVAVGLNMPWLISFNASVADEDCTHPMGAPFLRYVIREVESISAEISGLSFTGVIRRLLALAGGPRDLRDVDMSPAEWRQAAADALSSDRARNNPRRIMLETLIERFVLESEDKG
jgi:alcohol dehydrogenase class IV